MVRSFDELPERVPVRVHGFPFFSQKTGTNSGESRGSLDLKGRNAASSWKLFRPGAASPPYHFGMRPNRPPTLTIDATLLKAGLRLAVGLSGGADSVALLRTLAARGKELGLVLHAAHLHHGLRGEEADGDLAFARTLAAELGLPFHEARVDTAAEARARLEAGQTGPGKSAETIEEAARRLRYGWFRQLMASGEVEAVATAHTRDDQAETVLAKFLRGAWTEGLSGIHPVVEFPEGRILRPLLTSTRAEVELYLGSLGQNWREDSSNHHLTFTRNRIRHELLPLLESWNPRLREHLAQMASLARDEEACWQAELARLGPQLLLPGRPVRGGGRAAGDLLAPSLSIDVTRLAALAPALQRRLLRYAAEELGVAVDFPATEALRTLALTGRAGQKRELAQGLRAERTPRELRLAILPVAPVGGAVAAAAPEYTVTIPGEVTAPAFVLRLRIEADAPSGLAESPSPAPRRTATLRNWRPGDRVRLRYSASPRKVKEVLERLRVTGSSRALWPVLELDGRIVWMQGAEVEPVPGICITATSQESFGAALPPMGISSGG
jgi:tRNA(Ile)-lysidine synthase